MPAEVVQTLDRAFARALQDYGKEIEDQYNKMGTELSYLNSADFSKQLKSDNENAKKIIEEIQKSAK